MAAGFLSTRLIADGFAISELKSAGVSARILQISARCSCAELRDGGFTADELKSLFSYSELREGGFTGKELMAAGLI